MDDENLFGVPMGENEMKRWPSLPCVQSALDEIRKGLNIDTRTWYEKREDREIADGFDVDEALRKAKESRNDRNNS
jgi:hypothetical protein